MPVNIKAKLIKKEELLPGIIKFSVQADDIVQTAKPGNFIEIRVLENTEPFLRRPISIYNMDKENGVLEFIFQVKGKGTTILGAKQVGDYIDIIGPLGFGTFKYADFENLAIIGGGIGTFPLYELAKCAKNDKKKVHTYLGFRNKDLVTLEDEFKAVSDNITITTDDGSYANQGYAIDFLLEDFKAGKIDSIYACGPLPMLRVVRKVALENDIPCQISLEELMACGMGVCLGCAVKKASSTDVEPEYLHVCKAGPVFNAKDVDI